MFLTYPTCYVPEASATGLTNPPWCCWEYVPLVELILDVHLPNLFTPHTRRILTTRYTTVTQRMQFLTAVKGFQGRSRSIAIILKAVLSAQVCASGCDWLESVALLLSVSEHDRVDVMALGGAKICMM